MSKYIGSSAVNLSTTSADVTGNADIDGNLTVGGNLTVSGTTITVDHATAQTVDLGDGDKIRLGADYELQLWSDGTTGQISGDFNHTGSITTDGLTVDGDTRLDGGASGSDTYLRFTEWFGGIQNAGFYLHLDGTDDDLYIGRHDTADTNVANDKPVIGIDRGTGDISFYNDSGNAKFFWDASAESLGIGTSSLTTSDGSNIELSSATSSRIILDSTGTGGRKYTMASGTNGSLDFYDYDASAYRMRITSAGNVGIGTSSPAQKLHIYEAGTGSSFITLDNTQSGTATTIGKQGSSAYGATAAGEAAFYTYDNSISIMADGGAGNTASIKFSTGGNAERMRIDSSGNLLVGTTVTTPAQQSVVTGVSLRTTGAIESAANNGNAARFNRLTSDGSIVDFRKDGTNVGSIRSISGDSIGVGNGNAGLRFVSATNRIQPVIMSNGLNSDGLTDLGDTNKRFQDLYLSGGVYLGGTGSANKLDDYEEGNFTPVIRGTGAVFAQSYSSQIGEYTKIGRMVYCTFHVQLTDIGSITGDLIVAGLPFSMKAGNGVGGGTIGFASNLGAAASAVTINNAGGQSYAYLQYYPSSNSAAAPVVNSTSLASSTMRIDGTIYFQTS